MVLTPPSEGGEGRCLNPRLAPWATLCCSFGAEFLNELLTQGTGIVLEMRGPLNSVARIPRSFKLTHDFADCLFVFRHDVPSNLVNGFVTSQVGGIWHLRELPRVSSRSQPRLANRETVCVQARLPVTLAIRQLPPEWLSMPPQRERQRSSPPSPSQTPRVESCAPEAKQPERSRN